MAGAWSGVTRSHFVDAPGARGYLSDTASCLGGRPDADTPSVGPTGGIKGASFGALLFFYDASRLADRPESIPCSLLMRRRVLHAPRRQCIGGGRPRIPQLQRAFPSEFGQEHRLRVFRVPSMRKLYRILQRAGVWLWRWLRRRRQ